MAIVQSILVGKGKGKIGNVVLSGLKGQTIAKQLNSSPSNPRTVAQTANRVKMANAVSAWQFLANFMGNAKAIRKPLESVYNAFIRTVVNNMGTTLAASRVVAAQYALATADFAGNWFRVTIGYLEDGAVNISLVKEGISWSSSMRVSAIVLDKVTNSQAVIDRAVTVTEFNSGTFVLQVGPATSNDSCAVYLYDSAGSKITNIAFAAN